MKTAEEIAAKYGGVIEIGPPGDTGEAARIAAKYGGVIEDATTTPGKPARTPAQVGDALRQQTTSVSTKSPDVPFNPAHPIDTMPSVPGTTPAGVKTPYRPSGYETKDFMGPVPRALSAAAEVFNPWQLWDPLEKAGQETGEAIIEGGPMMGFNASLPLATTAADMVAGAPGALYDSAKQSVQEIGSGDIAGGLTRAAGTALSIEQVGKAGIQSGRSLANAVSTLRTGRAPVPPNIAALRMAQYNDLSQLSGAPALDIFETQPHMQNWMQQHGLTPQQIVTTKRGAGLFELERGLSEKDWNALAKSLGKDPKRMAPLPLEAASGAVDQANIPFKQAVKNYGELPTRDIATNIEGQLRKMADNTVDDGLKRTYSQLADKVAAQGSTLEGLMELKAWANKEATSLYALGPGGQINAAGARPIAAYSDMANAIRRDLYPRIKAASEGAMDLSEAGRIEGQAIQFRDGVFKSYENAAIQHATLANKKWWQKIMPGPEVFGQSKKGMAIGMAARNLQRLPLEEYNRLFQNGVGIVPNALPPPLPTGPGYVGPRAQAAHAPATIAGKPQLINDVISHDVNAPLLAPPPGTSPAIGQDIFGVQQRASQAARIAPPETVSGAQQQLPGTAPGGTAGTPVLSEQGVARPVPGAMDPASAYQLQLRQQANARAMAPEGPPPGQLNFDTLLPPDLLGPVSGGPSGAPVPTGTRLNFVSRNRGGAPQYHYVTPEGTTFVLDYELNLKPPAPDLNVAERNRILYENEQGGRRKLPPPPK